MRASAKFPHGKKGTVVFLEVGGEADRLGAQRQGEATPIMFGLRSFGSALLHLGEFAAANEQLEKMLELADSARHELTTSVYGIHPRTAAPAFLSLSLFASGQHGRAQAAERPAAPLAARALSRRAPKTERMKEPQHIGAGALIVGKPIPQRVGPREHPLTHRHLGQHTVHQMRGSVRHAPAHTRGTETPALA